VEERLDLSAVSGVEPAPSAGDDAGDAAEPEPKVRRDVDVEVNGRRFGVTVWVPESQLGAAANPGAGPRTSPRPRRSSGASAATAGSGRVAVPMQGTIVKVLVGVGDTVDEGQTVCVLEAMKMENNIAADRSGTVAEVKVEAGQSVGSGDVVVVIE
jgi:acetyl-CoA/propionyl-CoA carboxylase, biotin carboxylase, biotin carboxyl carrier protein